MYRLLTAALMLVAGQAGATGEINVLTDLRSPFPAGCVGLALPQEPVSPANTLVDEIVPAPSANSDIRDAEVRILIWRIGCHEPGYSVVMVRFEEVGGSPRTLVPQVFAEAGQVDFPYHVAQLIPHPAIGHAGATGNSIEGGRTYMLAVEPFAVDDREFTVDDYNDAFTLEFYWGDFVSDFDADPGLLDGEIFDVPEYLPEDDPTQFEYPLLHGRMSGQWIIDGMPSTGLSLMIGEQEDDTNFAFALFFTYLDGAPFWVTGNTGGEEPGFDLVEFDMYIVSGGEFFGFGPGTFDQDDLDQEKIGLMSIEAIDCNNLLIGYDFSEAGLGSGVLEARRMVDIAGYDCNVWE